MKWWRRKQEFEAEMGEELRDHLERQTEANVAAGMTPEEARRQAKLQLGAVEGVKESCREERRGFWVETLWADVRYGLRMLRKNPGFTAVAVVTLALGIGANAAIFGLVDSTLFRAVPFGEPERLVHIWTTDSAGELHTPVPAQYSAVQKYNRVFDEVAGMGWVDNFYGSDESGWETLPGLVVSSNWLSTLGVQPVLGRNFLDDEQSPGRDGVVMLSYGCWRIRFHGDPHVIGKGIVLNRRPVSIVGVLPQSLEPYYDADIFAPLVLQTYESARNLRDGFVRVRIVARLKPGISVEQARSDARAIGDSLRGAAPVTDRRGHLMVEDFSAAFREMGPTMQNARRGLVIMAIAAGIVLLIACANVASLLLARGVRRNKEFTVRTALGCSRGRMVRQLLTESALLFLCGGTVGLLAARWSQEIISKMASGMFSSGTVLVVDARVFAVGLAVSLVTSLVFGMAPALHASRVSLSDSLKDTTARAASSSRSRRARSSLLVFQIALGMVLLVGFGLLFRSLLHVESSPLGFDARNLLTATVTLPPSRYVEPSSSARLMREAVERTRSIPGVESAGIADSLPMEGADSADFRIERPSGKDAPASEETWFLSVSPEYFPALRVPMVRGRTFDGGDTQEGRRVAVVNETFAKAYFPGGNPVGYHVAFADSAANPIEIVGVVSDFRQRNPEEDLRPLLYFPVAQTLPQRRWSMAIRVQAGRDMGTVGGEIGKWLRPVDPQLYWEIGTMAEHVRDSESLTLRRPIIALLGSIGGLAIVLVLVGVFGVTSYTVAERTREIGIRVALGAAHIDVAALVLRESLRVASAGLALGTAAAFFLARLFPTQGIGWSGSGIFLYHVSRTDSIAYAGGAVLVMSIVLAASWIPARRAMRVDPMVALRHE